MKFKSCYKNLKMIGKDYTIQFNDYIYDTNNPTEIKILQNKYGVWPVSISEELEINSGKRGRKKEEVD